MPLLWARHEKVGSLTRNNNNAVPLHLSKTLALAFAKGHDIISFPVASKLRPVGAISKLAIKLLVTRQPDLILHSQLLACGSELGFCGGGNLHLT